MNPKQPRIVRPEDEDRRERPQDAKTAARRAGVESLPDGEDAAREDAKQPRDD